MLPMNARPKLAWWPLALAAAALGILVYAAIPGPPPEPSVLKGRWLREGDPYCLSVKEVRPDGAADVEYFNPAPIRVGEARAIREGGKVGLRVVLRDEKYPGSAYTLTHDPGEDCLKGEYYQAVDKVTFPVTFRREK